MLTAIPMTSLSITRNPYKMTYSSGEAINYYGGIPVGVCSIFACVEECDGFPVQSIYTKDDLPGYQSHSARECPMCKARVKLDALVNSHGISSF